MKILTNQNVQQIELYKKVDGGLQCILCPHFCIIKEGKSGKCRVRKSDGEKITLPDYGCLTHIAIEPIEKKPIKHFLEDTKTLSIGGFSCNLNCVFCENNKISQHVRKDISKHFYPSDVVSIAKEKHCKSVCMTYNEPTIFYEYLIDVANECHKNDLKFILKTNAYINKEPWAEICGVIDAVNVDWKGSESQYKEITGADSYVIEDRIKEAYNAGVHVEISIPLYHGFLEDVRAFYKCGSFLNSLNKEIPCHLLKVFAANEHEEFPSTLGQVISTAQEILSYYMDRVYISK
jgi:pyruvate formate lyase activating enzyme